MIFRLFITSLFFISINIQAKIINECGLYYVEGTYVERVKKGKNKRLILLNKGTNSEIRFYIKNKNIEKILPHTLLDSKLRLILNFQKKCWFSCKGEVSMLLRVMPPFDAAQVYLNSRPRPISGQMKKCKY